MPTNTAYDLKSVKLPYLSGFTLKAFVALLEGPLGGLLIPSLLQSAGVTHLRGLHFDEPPTNFPIHYVGTPAPADARIAVAEDWSHSPSLRPGFRFASAMDYVAAYRSGAISPEEVAQQVLAAIESSNAADPPLRAIINVIPEELLRLARESAQRYREGCPRGPLDGVPVAVKDEVDMLPYPTTVGTAFLGQAPVTEDATVVARFRAAGALLIGKANMHEIGIGVTGLNPHHGTARNPYNPAHYTGGSSSGAAAAVAAGLCPIAIGADGGGSIRIPSAFCGVVGLKPTYGRVSEFGAAPLDWSIAHIGPLAASVADAALGYAFMAGPDAKDANSLLQPAPTLEGWHQPELQNLRIGVFWPWFRHATAEVVTACEALLKQFEGFGAQLREVVIPDLEAARVAHVITIATEMAQAMDRFHAEHHRQHGLDVRTNLTLARAFTSMDYVKAQRVRTRLIAHFRKAFESVDVIVTPTTGLAAPAIPASALPAGDSDLTTLTEIMRFATPANLTGLPAISFPAGYTPQGLPVGMQAIGRAWDEVTLLRLALAAENLVERQLPKVHFRLL
ncbi:MAG: amidase [Anaerolineae bacterium]|jgi:Asp-tRNA(Asn)/Glu-tRNA(Gln) amidotransferase A subunit family amidase|nr:amidase [Anaerolineae bacterium]